MSRIKQKLLFYTGYAAQKLQSVNNYILEADGRPDADIPLVFFSGENGVDYLNASLYSVYKSWKQLPTIKIIFPDETPIEVFKKKIIKWPRDVEVIPWQKCAEYFKNKGNTYLHEYAVNYIFGKKLVGVLYCALKEKILYTDTDVLWFNNPETLFPKVSGPYLMMGTEAADPCYNMPLVNFINKEISSSAAFNSGIMFVQGDFSVYPKWTMLCEYLANYSAKYPDSFTEQTTFAILANHFGKHWNQNEIFLRVDDQTELIPKKYKKNYNSIYARHYVFTKTWLFWRDFFFFIKKSKNRV